MADSCCLAAAGGASLVMREPSGTIRVHVGRRNGLSGTARIMVHSTLVVRREAAHS